MNRCINIDWLEVFAREPSDIPHNAKYYQDRGFQVKERNYGTPQYREMFTIYQDGFPYLEIRRDPYSLKKNGGIFNSNDCHIRLSNRTCYDISPVDDLRLFMLDNNYTYVSLSRIDICLDFNFFDLGQNPRKILEDYMENRISKINQCNTAAYGKDTWAGRKWNSLKWGSEHSPISTKIYEKTLELKEKQDKFYIRDCWKEAGLRDDIPIWRVEFSIKSDIKHFVRIDTGELLPNDFSSYDNRHKCLFRFHSLAARYFHFKIVEKTENGKYKRKDRCKDKILFKINKEEEVFKPIRLTVNTEPTRTDKMIVKKLAEMLESQYMSRDIRESARKVMIKIAHDDRMMEYLHYIDYLIMDFDK